MAKIKIINKYECGCEEIKLELDIPGETDNEIRPQPRPCMSCLTAQWRKDKEEGFSLRDMLHGVLREEEEGSTPANNDEVEED